MTKIARDFLSILATSVPVERIFSKASLVARKHRNRLNKSQLEGYYALIRGLLKYNTFLLKLISSDILVFLIEFLIDLNNFLLARYYLFIFHIYYL